MVVRNRRLSRAGGALLVAGALAVIAAAAQAGTPGHWTQITREHSGASSNLGLARGKDGTLHVLWAGPARRAFTAIFDTPISPAGTVRGRQTVTSGWVGVNAPAAVALPDGSIHGVVSGQKVQSNNDPHAGLNEVVGPGTWKLGAQAFGKFSITVPSNANVRTAALKGGELVTVWTSGPTMLLQTGVDPTTQPQDITPKGDPVVNPVVAVDQATGAVVIAYHGVSSGAVFFRQVLPGLAAPKAMPQSKTDGPSIAARAGGGVYAAYTPGGNKVLLLRFGSAPKPVPVPNDARVLTAGVAAGPEGRLWIFYGDERTTWVTRTNKAASGHFEPVQALKSPPGTVQYFRLEGEGSAGPLDLFADITVDGKTKDGSYHQQVQPILSVSATKKPVKNAQGQVTGVRVTVRVTDAGDGIKGARVSGLPGSVKPTDATGATVFVATAGKKGTFTLIATKAGYVAAKGKLAL